MNFFKTISRMLIARLILAIILITFGANKLFHFMPMFQFTGASKSFYNGMIESKYLFPFLGIIEMLVGFLLITRRAVPFALIVLAPISINIILFHVFLFPSGILPGLIVFLLNIYLVKRYWHRYESLFE